MKSQPVVASHPLPIPRSHTRSAAIAHCLALGLWALSAGALAEPKPTAAGAGSPAPALAAASAAPAAESSGDEATAKAVPETENTGEIAVGATADTAAATDSVVESTAAQTGSAADTAKNAAPQAAPAAATDTPANADAGPSPVAAENAPPPAIPAAAAPQPGIAAPAAETAAASPVTSTRPGMDSALAQSAPAKPRPAAAKTDGAAKPATGAQAAAGDAATEQSAPTTPAATEAAQPAPAAAGAKTPAAAGNTSAPKEQQPAPATQPSAAADAKPAGEPAKTTDGQETAAPAAAVEPPPKAESVDLKQVVPATDAPAPAPILGPQLDAAAAALTPPNSSLVLLGTEVPVATTARLAWSPTESFTSIAAPTPVLVVNGAKPGPVLCLTAAVHGDELNGIEIVRRILYELDPQQLSGAIIGVPIVNLQGFRRNSRYLPDRRDLNRFFPGNPEASSAARIAYSFFHEVILHCNALVDLHTGSFHRTNLPQVRADLTDPGVAKLSQGFGATVVLKSKGDRGTLRRAAVEAGIPAVTLEAGEPMRLQENEVSHGVKSIQTLLGQMGMTKRASLWGTPEPIYYKSRWVRAGNGGILLSRASLGKRVTKGEVLGTVTDPITNARTEIQSPYTGRVIGMALNQVVMPGFAAYHIGIQATEEQIRKPDPNAEDTPADDGDDDPLPESQPAGEERAEGIEDS